MKANFSLKSGEIHLWSAWLPDFSASEADFACLLNEDEAARAARFRFPIHKQRFTIARGILRQLLSRYTQIPPQSIEFTYGLRGKPYLRNNPQQLQFNVSHSHDVVVYAIRVGHEIGVDIEKIEDYKDGVAERFFSPKEYAELSALSSQKQRQAFFHIWAAKEAIIKTVGEGLYIELGDFTVLASERVQVVELTHANKTQLFYVENFSVHADYQSAFSTSVTTIEKVLQYQWDSSCID